MSHHAADPPSQEIEQRIKSLYHSYRHTSHIDAKGLFFSPACLQICHPVPTYCATSRSQIVQYLKDAQQGKVPLEHNVGSDDLASSSENVKEESTGHYTIRPLRESEYEFELEAATAAVGLTPAELRARAEAEGWIGMRVDLWDEGSKAGLLVKVKYWWRLEAIADEGGLADDGGGKGWRQCLHDIMYLGPRDGTEGEEGLEVLR